MPGVVSIGRPYEPVEVDLWGTVFETIPATKSVGEKAAPLIDKVNEAVNNDDLIKAQAALLDIRLRPVEGTRKASTIIKAKWKADEVTVDQINRLMDDIREADRPT